MSTFNIRYILCLSSLLFTIRHSLSSEVRNQTDFCEIHHQLEKSEVLLQDALEGMTITAALSGNIDNGIENHDIWRLVMDETARRGKFNVFYANAGAPGENETYTDLLVRNTEKYDVSVDWWERRLVRLSLGIVFPEEWWNADTIMIRKVAQSTSKFTFWAFADPFTPCLWLLTVSTIFFTGMAYHFLDYLRSCRNANRESKGSILNKRGRKLNKELDPNFYDNVFLSFYAYTGNCNYEPKSKATKLLSFSMCFMYLLIVSAYTANLATFLISKFQTPMVINDIEDAVSNNKEICVRRGYPSAIKLKTLYPRVMMHEFDSDLEQFTALNEGQCYIALTTVEDWKSYERDDTYNQNCNLEWVGRNIDSVSAGFALKDSASRCTSLFKGVLDYYLVQMKIDGTLEDLWEQYRTSLFAATCISEKDTTANRRLKGVAGKRAKNSTSDNQLNIQNMGGIFAFHMFLVVLSIFLEIYDICRTPKDVRHVVKTEMSRKADDVRKNITIGDLNKIADDLEAADSFKGEARPKTASNIPLKKRDQIASLFNSIIEHSLGEIRETIFEEMKERVLELVDSTDTAEDLNFHSQNRKERPQHCASTNSAMAA